MKDNLVPDWLKDALVISVLALLIVFWRHGIIARIYQDVMPMWERLIGFLVTVLCVLVCLLLALVVFLHKPKTQTKKLDANVV